MTVLEPSEPAPEPPAAPLRYWQVALVTCLGIALSIAAFYGVSDREQERQHHRLEQQATSVASTLISNLDDYLGVLYAVRAFYDANEEVDRRQFRTFAASTLARHEGIQALEWVPWVREHDRPAFEARARADGLADFRLTERDAAGRLVPAAARKEYFPVYFVEPQAGNAQALGHTPLIETREQALSRARDAGGAIATERFKLIQDRTGGAGVVVFLPVYRGGGIPPTLAERRARLKGFVEGVFRVDDIVGTAMRGMGSQSLDFHLYDDSAEASRRFLLGYANGVALRSPASASGATWSTDFDFAGRRWSFTFFPPPDATSGGLFPWGALVAGLLCTGLSGGYLFSLLSRKADIEREVVERTTENQRAFEEIARRTMELHRAQDLDRLKTNFVSAVSHDLRAPLTSILGYAEFLEEGIGGALRPSQRDFVRQIGKSTRRMEHLLDDLLDYARIDAGTFVLRVQPMDVSEQIREIADSLRPQLAEARLALEVAVPPAPLLAALDAQRIERVLINLLNNAIKFTPAEGTIRVRAMREAGEVRLEVEDTGIGIASEDLPRLFQPFAQLESGLHRGGAGLGLSISKTIVEAHGGSIEVKSALGRGSVFVLRFPETPERAAETALSL
ncbi:MAG TPA: CHASE domain-containing protein [Pantanalinema sp.]